MNLDADALPNTPEVHHAILCHMAREIEFVCKGMERLERQRERDRDERRALERVSRTLSTTALQLLGAKALSVIVPPTRLVAAVGMAAFLGGFLAQLAALKLGMQPFPFAR